MSSEPGRNRRALLASLVAEGHGLATSAINIAEVYAGMRPGEEGGTEAFLSSLDIMPWTEQSLAERAH